MSKRTLKIDDGYFDDCPLCQAMKNMGIKQQAVDDEGEMYITPIHPKQAEALKNAMREAQKKGFPAGGNLFD